MLKCKLDVKLVMTGVTVVVGLVKTIIAFENQIRKEVRTCTKD